MGFGLVIRVGIEFGIDRKGRVFFSFFVLRFVVRCVFRSFDRRFFVWVLVFVLVRWFREVGFLLGCLGFRCVILVVILSVVIYEG